MVRTTDLQTLQLDPMIAGVEYLLVITNATVNSTLQFKHVDDPTTRDHPDATNMAGPTVIKKFMCPSPIMALVFATPPASTYYVSVVPVTSQEF